MVELAALRAPKLKLCCFSGFSRVSLSLPCLTSHHLFWIVVANRTPRNNRTNLLIASSASAPDHRPRPLETLQWLLFFDPFRRSVYRNFSRRFAGWYNGILHLRKEAGSLYCIHWQYWTWGLGVSLRDFPIQRLFLVSRLALSRSAAVCWGFAMAKPQLTLSSVITSFLYKQSIQPHLIWSNQNDYVMVFPTPKRK